MAKRLAGHAAFDADQDVTWTCARDVSPMPNISGKLGRAGYAIIASGKNRVTAVTCLS
jgi:hypothetical protein